MLCSLSDELIYDLDPKLNELEPVDKHATGKWQLIFTLTAWPSGLSFGRSQTGILCTDSTRGHLGCARTRGCRKKNESPCGSPRDPALLPTNGQPKILDKTNTHQLSGRQHSCQHCKLARSHLVPLSMAIEIMALYHNTLQVVYSIFFSLISQVSN